MSTARKITALTLILVIAFMLPGSAYTKETYEYSGTNDEPMAVGLDEYRGTVSSQEDIHYYKMTNTTWKYESYIFWGILITSMETYVSNTTLRISVENPDGQSVEVEIKDEKGVTVQNGSFDVEGTDSVEYVFEDEPEGYFYVTITPKNAESSITYMLNMDRSDALKSTQKYTIPEIISVTAGYWWDWIINLFIHY